MLNIVIKTKIQLNISFHNKHNLTCSFHWSVAYSNPGSGYVSMTILHIPLVIDLTPSSWKCYVIFTDGFPPLFHRQQISQSPESNRWSGGQLHWRVYQASRWDGWIYFSPVSKGCNLAPIFRNWALYRWGLSQLLFSEVCLWGHSASQCPG